MARYLVLAEMLTVPRPMPVAEADSPAEAVRKARELEKAGRQGIQIGDTQAEQYYSIAHFAAQHGVR